MSFTFKSVIIDIADNWGDSSYVGFRQMDFWFEDAKILLEADVDFVGYSTSHIITVRAAKWCFDTTLSKTGGASFTSWAAPNGTLTNQRIICVFNTPQTADKIVVNNEHANNSTGGVESDRGSRNVKVTISDDEITSTVYNEAISNSTVIYDSTFDQHVASNVEDPQELTLINQPIDLPDFEVVATMGVGSAKTSAPLPDFGVVATMGVGSIFNGISVNLPDFTAAATMGIGSATTAAPFPNFEVSATIEVGASVKVNTLPDFEVAATMDLSSISAFTTLGAAIHYFLTLTGAADSLDDLELPMKSFQANRRSGNPTFLSANVPTVDFSEQIAARSNGNIKIDQGYIRDGEVLQRETIIETALDRADVFEGGRNNSQILIGFSTETFASKSVTLSNAISRSITDGTIRYRLAEPNITLNPGDEVTIGNDTFTVDTMSYAIAVKNQSIDISGGVGG